MNYLNQEVMSKFQQLKKTHTTIISSAALPYAQELGKIIGANKIFTSEEIEGKWVENSSQNKADKLVLEFQDQSKFDYFFTDHREDLPLAKLCQKVYIVRPTQKSLDEFKTSLENFTLLE
jgi:phosphoserine phosphatase